MLATPNAVACKGVVPRDGRSIAPERGFLISDFIWLRGCPGAPARAVGGVRGGAGRHRDIDVTIAAGSRAFRSIDARARERGAVLRYGVGMRLGLTIVAALGLLGCGDFSEDAGADTDDFIDMDTPPGNCSAGTGLDPCPDPGASTGIPEGGACRDSGDCAQGNHCIAPFVGGDVGDFVCTAQCIALEDESAWCLDASACCDAGAVCSARGLCVEGALDDSGTAGDSGSGTAGDGTTGDGTSSGSGSGTAGGSESSGSDSDSGGSSGTTGAMGAG